MGLISLHKNHFHSSSAQNAIIEVVFTIYSSNRWVEMEDAHTATRTRTFSLVHWSTEALKHCESSTHRVQTVPARNSMKTQHSSHVNVCVWVCMREGETAIVEYREWDGACKWNEKRREERQFQRQLLFYFTLRARVNSTKCKSNTTQRRCYESCTCRAEPAQRFASACRRENYSTDDVRESGDALLKYRTWRDGPLIVSFHVSIAAFISANKDVCFRVNIM